MIMLGLHGRVVSDFGTTSTSRDGEVYGRMVEFMARGVNYVTVRSKSAENLYGVYLSLQGYQTTCTKS